MNNDVGANLTYIHSRVEMGVLMKTEVRYTGLDVRDGSGGGIPGGSRNPGSD